MSLHPYLAYGLCIHAYLVCPELPSHPQPRADPDVIVRLLAPVSTLSNTLDNGYFEVRPGIFRLAIPGVSEYRGEEGKRIFIEPLVDGSTDKVGVFLLGS